MPLQVAVGHASLTGPRERNEDFCGVATPVGLELENKGVLAAVADGIGGHKGGREAAEYTVRGLLADYFATPDTWSVPRAIETVTTALNRWVMAEASRNAELAGMATTLSGLVLRGQRFYTAHIGDSRIYRMRDGRLDRLTVDHIWEHPELKNVLSRAVGLDPRVLMDFADGELALNDRFLLVSDGVWGVLADVLMAEVLLDHPEPQAAAAALTSLALAQGGHDNATAVIVDVLALPAASLRDSLESDARLPLPHRMKVGHDVDGLVVEEILHDSRETLLYRVRDARSGQQCVLKTLQEGMAGDVDACAALLMEEWRARRVISPFFPQVVPADKRSCLYYLMTWHAGATLQARLDAGQHFPVGEVARFGIALLKAIAALHRLDIVHRDIKPDNIHLGQDGVLRILDLGVAFSSGEGGADAPVGRAGTPSYMAPESVRRCAARSGFRSLRRRRYALPSADPEISLRRDRAVPDAQVHGARPADPLAAGDSGVAGEHPAQGGGARGEGPLRDRRGIPARARTRGGAAAGRPRSAPAGAAQSAADMEVGRRRVAGAEFHPVVDPVALEFAA